MTSSKRNAVNSSLFVAAALTIAFGASSCISTKRSGGDAGGPGNNSIVASIGGIADVDSKRPGLGYFLVCDTGVTVTGDVSKEGDKDVVKFAGTQVKEGNTCAMEIRAGATDPILKDLNYVWYGYADGKAVPGLLYGSDQQKVASKKLKLQLYKLYSLKCDECFNVTVNVDFDITDAALTPVDAKSSANLICSATEQYSGSYKKTADKQATLSFENLKVADFASKTCDRLVVMVDSKEAFSGPSSDLQIKTPKKGDLLKFPTAADKRYTLKASVPADTLSIDTRMSDADCVRYENQPGSIVKKCVERRSVVMPFAKNFFVAKVQGKKADGSSFIFTVASGENGIQLFDGNKLSVDAVNAAVSANASDAQKKALHFYNEAAADLLTGSVFESEFLKTAAEDQKVKASMLSGITFFHIVSLQVHGFHQVEEKALNDKPTAFWMAAIKATKTGATEHNLFVTGYDKYFHSHSVPATTDQGNPTYVNGKTLIADFASAQPNERWRLYAIKGASLAPSACELDNLMTPASLKTSDELNGTEGLTLADGAPADAKFDACEVSKDLVHSGGIDASYTVSASTFHVWEWFSLIP